MAQVIEMLKAASGPQGSWSKGYQYEIDPDLMDFAEALVAAGSARWIEGATVADGPSPGGRAPKH